MQTLIKLKAGKIKVDDIESDSQINILRQYKKSIMHEVITGKKQVYGLAKEKTTLLHV